MLLLSSPFFLKAKQNRSRECSSYSLQCYRMGLSRIKISVVDFDFMNPLRQLKGLVLQNWAFSIYSLFVTYFWSISNQLWGAFCDTQTYPGLFCSAEKSTFYHCSSGLPLFTSLWMVTLLRERSDSVRLPSVLVTCLFFCPSSYIYYCIITRLRLWFKLQWGKKLN